MLIKFILKNIDIISRTLLSSLLLFTLTRILGKKQISQLTFFDYVVGITIGSIAATFSIDDTIAYSHGVVSIIIWGTLPLLVSLISLKSIIGRRLFEGTATILVQNGKILEKNLQHSRLHINDLLEELRLQGVFYIEDVDFAILETNGKLSVLLKPEKQPVISSDLNIKKQFKGLCANIIIDGKIMKQNLELIKRNETWLRNQLSLRKISSINDVLLACVDSSGVLHIDLKHKKTIELNVLD